MQPTTLSRTLRLTGAVAYNNFRTTPVITQVSGPVSRMVVVPGQKVRQGQPMLYVASPDYSQLRTNYLKAKDAYSLAQKNYVRSQDLYQHHAIAVKDLEQAESAEVQAGGDLASAEAALKVMGVTDPDAMEKGPSSYEVPVRAPIGGEVVEQLVSAGQLLQPGNTQCFTISDTGTMWVLVNVYQKDLPYVRAGDHGHDSNRCVSGYLSRTHFVCGGRARSQHSHLDRAYRDPEPGRKLKKDMYVTATVQAGRFRTSSPCPIPRCCGTTRISLLSMPRFPPISSGRRPVTIGESQQGKTEITAGLHPGDRVIGDGSLFLQFANSLQR